MAETNEEPAVFISLVDPVTGACEPVCVVALGDGTFRLEEERLLWMSMGEDEEDVERRVPGYKDVFTGTWLDEETIELGVVVRRTNLRKYDLIIPESAVTSGAYMVVANRVRAEGGDWERFMGGYFMLWLPADSNYDPVSHMTKLMSGVEARSCSPNPKGDRVVDIRHRVAGEQSEYISRTLWKRSDDPGDA